MKLTPENKAHIDRLSYEQLRSKWRDSTFDDQWFNGETEKYWLEQMRKKYPKLDGHLVGE